MANQRTYVVKPGRLDATVEREARARSAENDPMLWKCLPIPASLVLERRSMKKVLSLSQTHLFQHYPYLYIEGPFHSL